MNYSYLALGDSYTVGEQVLLADSFPYQTVQLLRQNNLPFFAPEIIAKNEWTTEDLQKEIDTKLLLKKYDFVSLLIGVNNQYRGKDLDEYGTQFEHLLKKAINLCSNNVKNVFVLSIPDWSTMPFAKDRDIEKIAEEIKVFNKACKKITKKLHCTFINITASQIKDSDDPKMIAEDGLHPSVFEYTKWAKKLAAAIAEGCSL
jgi:lysophospholipase L1-like esterase